MREARRAAAESPPLDDPGAFARNLAGRASRVKAAATRPVSPLDEEFEAEDLNPDDWRHVDPKDPKKKR